jgi:hypothetical protein
MAGIGVAHVECDFHHAPLRLAEQALRLVHPQVDVVTRRRHAHRSIEEAIEIKLAQSGLSRELVEIKSIRQMCSHPIGQLSHLVAGQRRTAAARFADRLGIVARQMDGDGLRDALQ